MGTSCAAVFVLMLVCVDTISFADNKENSPDGQSVTERGAFEIGPPEGKAILKLNVSNRLGDVHVVGHDLPTLVVQATKRAPNQKGVERLSVSVVPDSNGAIRVSTSMKAENESIKFSKDDVWVDLDIFVPKSANVDAKTWFGDLSVLGVDNGSSVRSKRGNIELKQIMGLIELESRRGSHSVRETVGEVRANVLTGDMHMGDISGEDLNVRMHVGDVDLSNIRSKHVVVTTSNGHINISKTWSPDAKYEVSTLHGSITWRGTGKKTRTRLKMGPKATINLPDNAKSKEWGSQKGRLVLLGGGKLSSNLTLKSLDGTITITEF